MPDEAKSFDFETEASENEQCKHDRHWADGRMTGNQEVAPKRRHFRVGDNAGGRDQGIAQFLNILM